MRFVLKSNRAIVFSAVYGAILFVVNFFSGQLLSILFVIPGLSGVVTGFTVPLILIIGHLTIRRYGCITLIWTLYSVAAIPTALMGPPGPYKMIIGFSAGITFEAIIYLFKERNFSHYLGFIGYTIVMFMEFVFIFTYFISKPNNTSLGIIIGITIVFIIEGLFAIKVGKEISKRIIKQPFLKDI